jgi:class 3 adenylate cyclase/tetratricopeptide (TPR) repeat protein
VGFHQAFCGDCGLKQPTEALFFDPGVAGDERKRVTVLFADVVGSTAMISNLDIEQAALRLDRMLRDMAKIVADHGGFVSNLLGDGIKAVFGIPLAREDHAERACASALDIRAMARKGRAQVRAGLHSGEVLVRQLRTDVWSEYDAVGLTVHLAARLEQMARPGCIYLSAATGNIVEGRFRLRAAGKVKAKGITSPVEVFELLGETNRTRWAARSRGGLSKFVGRAYELGELIRLLGDCEPVVCVTGEAGSGKSRLIHELTHRREVAKWTVLRTEVEADDSHAGLRPFAQMLRSWLHTERNDTPAKVRDRLNAHLAAMGTASADACVLQSLLDVSGSEAWSDKNQIMLALGRLIVRHAELSPTLLVIEDVHWLERDTHSLLRFLNEVAKPNRLAIIITCRPYGAPATDVRHTMRLSPLSSDESRNLLNVRLGSSAALDALKSRILDRAGGIPLFIEELAKLAVEAADPDSAIPDGVHAVIGERIDRLPKTARDVLRIASVIGREAPLPVLCRVIARGEPELTSSLFQLEESGFIRIGRGGAEPRLEFSHVLTRDVAFAGLLTDERRRVHAAVLAAYEELYAARLDELVEKLGAHAIEASAWEKAEHYLRRSAQKAIDRSHHASAIRFIEMCLGALASANLKADERAERELTLRLLLRTAHNAIGNYPERFGNLERAEVLARSISWHQLLPTIWVSRASALLQLGQVEAAAHLLESALNVAAGHGDHDTGVIGGYMLSRTYFYAGRLNESLRIAGETLALLQAHPGPQRHGGGFGSSRVMLLTQLTQTGACLGRFSEARAHAAEALAAARESERSFDIALASYGLGVVQFFAGDIATAIAQLEQGVTASMMEGAQSVHVAIVALLGYAHLCAGRVPEAITLVRRALSHPEKSLYLANWPRLLGSLILQANGEAEEALRLAVAAHRVARKGPYPLQLAWSELVLGYLYRDAKSAVAARCFGRALAQARRLKMRPCVVRALMETADLKRRTGHKAEAQNLWRKATKLALDMGLTSTAGLAWGNRNYSVC